MRGRTGPALTTAACLAASPLEARRRNGIPVRGLLATDEGHGFRKHAYPDFQFCATAGFMREHLPGALP